MAPRTLLRAALLAVVLAGAASAESTQSIERAMGPYYAALVASARGNIDATSRNLLLFASRWDQAAREARTTPPAWVGQDPAWPALLDEVTAAIARTRDLVRLRDVASAHAELETIRSSFRELRGRHNALTFDDHMTDYHEAIERMLGHVAGRNEIRLTDKDYADAEEDLRSAQAAWQIVQRSAGAMAGQPAWSAAAKEAPAALAAAARALASKNATAAGQAAERVKTTYYDLLLAVGRARG
jgi:hypothetical protein